MKRRNKVACGVVVILAVLIGIILYRNENQNMNLVSEQQGVHPLLFRGNYIADYGEEVPYTGDADLNAKKINKLVLKGHFAQNIPKGQTVMMLLYRMKVTVLQNGVPIYTVENDTDRDSQSLIGTKWDNFVSPGIDKNDDMTITMEALDQNVYEGAYQQLLDTLCYGTEYQLLGEQICKNIGKIIIAIAIFIMGISLLVVTQSLIVMKASMQKSHISCALFLISGAICSFIDYDYITLLFPNPFRVHFVDLMTQLCICEFLMMYLKCFIKTKRFRRIVSAFIWGWSGFSAVYLVMQFNGNGSWENVVKVIIPIVLTMIGIEVIFLMKDSATNHSEDNYLYVFLSDTIVAAFTVVEIIHYYCTGAFLISLFQFGLLLFAVVQFGVLMGSTRNQLMEAERSKKLEAELADSRVKIMLSQIQPHFLYNSLSSIAGLCDMDSKQAKNAIVQFSDYLRGNLDSLKQKNKVMFEKELIHVKTYLDLEKMRFGEELRVVWDIQVNDFMIPSLSLQPLVENAVKYGIGKKEDGGTVWISTIEHDAEVEIVVKDDGIGYNPYEVQKDGRTHIGIENVRKRLKIQANGRLEIASETGKGTTARIFLPRIINMEK